MQILVKNKKWIVLDCDKDKALQISKEFKISPLIASVILSRGITDDEIKSYISKDSSQFHDPFLINGMSDAVNFIKNAVKTKTKIAVYGDYDVDGITSTYIVYDYLKSIGADIMYYIPDRADEGYGVNNLAIDYLKSQNVGLIITVDVGITAVEETKYAKDNGIDIIITDHHTPKDTLPNAVAVINPKINGNKYPNTELAGVGVAYKLVYAISGCDKSTMKKYSEAAAIGTIADMVPLKGENRFIASYGLGNLKTSQNIGLSALIEVAGIDKSQITSSNISFGLAPRINAAGRIASACISVELLLEKDKNKAIEIASCLDEDNKARQAEEHRILEEAEEIIQRDKLYEDNVIVVANKDWHHGVIGIVSSKITEKYYKPSTVISINDDGSAKASGRSIAGFNIFDALSSVSHTLVKYGGHDLAAGFSLEKDKIDEFRSAINDYSKNILTEELLTPKLVIDAVVSPGDISCSTAAELDVLEPFGIGNKTPVFCIKDTTVKANRIHKSGKHIFLTLEKSKVNFEAPAFNVTEATASLTQGEKISAAGTIGINTFRGVDNVQFVIKDIKYCDNSIIDDNSLRCVFVCIKTLIGKNIFSFKLNEFKTLLNNSGCRLGITKIKTALNIFKELKLLKYTIEGDTVNLTRDKNFYSKCNLEDSQTYVNEIKNNSERM